jgi:2-oxoisovalerate dehydrogenase E1 component
MAVDLVELYRRMLRIRLFETRASEYYKSGEIPGFVHISIGQEATAVGACWPLGPADYISSTHRGHGHCLAKGMEMAPMFAELFGRQTGVCAGRGGSMHIADPTIGMLGANGIVGAGLPISVGAAFASRLRGTDAATVAFFGDGAVATGAFHEAVNLAAVWKLPIVFFCENNGYAEFSPAATQHPVPVAERALAYGIEAIEFDGGDVATIATSMERLVGRLRCGEGPFLVEAHTHRWHGHYEGDPQKYRPEGELAAYEAVDPIERARQRMLEDGIDQVTIAAARDAVELELEAAVAEARAAPEPDRSTLFDFVIAPRAPIAAYAPDAEARTRAAQDVEEWKMIDAVRGALEHELHHDPDVFLAGIDVGRGGNVFAITRGLWEQWPDRVLDTPISETAIIGLAVGAAAAGLRPVVEIMYLDFIGVCLDQLLNQAAKLRFMTGGAISLPMTVRTQFGSGRSSGSQHSQSLEALLAHIPGLTVVMPSTAADAYGLLRAAIRDPNPVIVIENRALYGHREQRCADDHIVPIGQAAVVRAGRDLTIVSMSRMVRESLKAAAELEAIGIDAEVIDLRTIVPMDWPAVFASVTKTSRLLVAHEAITDFGVGAEIAARVADELFWALDAPIRRVGAPYTPAPYAPSLEREWMPGSATIVAAAKKLVAQ